MYNELDKDTIYKTDEASNQYKLEVISWTVKYKGESTPDSCKTPNLP